jgi:hypothetical protein
MSGESGQECGQRRDVAGTGAHRLRIELEPERRAVAHARHQLLVLVDVENTRAQSRAVDGRRTAHRDRRRARRRRDSARIAPQRELRPAMADRCRARSRRAAHPPSPPWPRRRWPRTAKQRRSGDGERDAAAIHSFHRMVLSSLRCGRAHCAPRCCDVVTRDNVDFQRRECKSRASRLHPAVAERGGVRLPEAAATLRRSGRKAGPNGNRCSANAVRTAATGRASSLWPKCLARFSGSRRPSCACGEAPRLAIASATASERIGVNLRRIENTSPERSRNSVPRLGDAPRMGKLANRPLGRLRHDDCCRQAAR